MLTLFVGFSTNPKPIIIAPNKTIKEVLKENGTPVVDNSIVMWNSTRLTKDDLNKTISELGFKEEDLLTISEKLVGN